MNLFSYLSLQLPFNSELVMTNSGVPERFDITIRSKVNEFKITTSCERSENEEELKNKLTDLILDYNRKCPL